MAYQITCDGFVLYDPRDEDLFVLNPKCNLEVNKVGEGSFTIFPNHPHYDKLKKLKSVFEIKQDGNIIFRGRMTNNSRDFYNRIDVDLEGVLAYANDTVSPPFNFPGDYPDVLGDENIVESFLRLVITWHNLRVEEWQKLKIGKVTVKDPNNYIARSSQSYSITWDILKTRLLDTMGGYLCVRYEEDGNYLDYLASFEETNNQEIVFGENLLDLVEESDASATYSAIVPIGKDGMTMGALDNGDEELWLTDDLVRWGDTIYSKSSVEAIGWICVPPEQSTWDDVTIVENLQTKGAEYLSSVAMKFINTIKIKATDLRFTNDQIQSFRIGQNVTVNSPVHGVINAVYPLTRLEIDLHNPQNTSITIGDSQLTLTDINTANKQDAASKADSVIVEVKKEFSESMTEQEQKILESCAELYNTKFEQLSKSITLELSGSLGNKASIKLSLNGNEYKDEIELSKVREAFANDNTAVTISAGVITFNSGTIVINSNNFKVSSQGVIEATSGTIGAITLCATGIYSHNATYSRSYAGWYRPTTITTGANCFFAGASDEYGTNAKFFVTYGGALTATDATIKGEIITESSKYMAKLDSGGLELYFDGVLCGTINTKYWSGASTEGVSLRVEEGGNYIMFSHADDTQGSGYVVDYYLNAGWSSNYDEMHIFQTSARFLDDAYFAGKTRIRSLRLFGSDGEYLVGIGSSGQLTVSKL